MLPDSPPPEEVVAELDALSASLDAAVPAKHLDRNLLIATWNIRAFGDLTDSWSAGEGDSPKRDWRALALIAEIVRRFDVVAVQEVRGNLRALRRLMALLGPDWGFTLTDVTAGSAGNDERLAFVFDLRRVKPSGLACELVVPPEWIERTSATESTLRDQFARTPYAVSFASAGQTFVLVTLHVLFGDSASDRTPELQGVADWLADWAKRADEYGQNLICLGDFNIDRQGDPNYEAFTSRGLAPPPELAGLPRTVFDDGADNSFFDQIAWFHDDGASRLSLTYRGRAGQVGFDGLFTELDDQDKSWRISDHYPLWAEFEV